MISGKNAGGIPRDPYISMTAGALVRHRACIVPLFLVSRCQMSGVRCQVSGARCQVSGVRCQVLGVRCQVLVVKGQVPGAKCQA